MEIYVDISDVAGGDLACIEVIEVTQIGDTAYVWSATVKVDRGASVGIHRYTFETMGDLRLNPIGLLRAALQNLDTEKIAMDGEVVDRANETPGTPALER